MHYVKQNGAVVFKHAVKGMYDITKKIMLRNDINNKNLKLFIAHQANKRIIESTSQKLKLKKEQVLININKYANTTAASIPIALSDACDKKLIKKNDKIILTAFGAGFTWGSCLLKWGFQVIDCAFVFPGQGSQYLGMCKDDFFSEYPYKTFFEIASTKFDIDILDVCRNGPIEKLNSTYIAQPAILIHSLIIDQILKNDVKPKAVAGHSLGEYTALISSGVLTFEECLDILFVRCREMEKANIKYKGTMLAIIGEDIETIQKVCNQFDNTVIANINSQNQIIISGPNSEIEKSIEVLKSYSMNKIIKLNVAGAFHSPLMDIANVSLNKVINSVNFKDANYAIYQNVSTKDLILVLK